VIVVERRELGKKATPSPGAAGAVVENKSNEEGA